MQQGWLRFALFIQPNEVSDAVVSEGKPQAVDACPGRVDLTAAGHGIYRSPNRQSKYVKLDLRITSIN
jgi:hypothetical protein